MKDLIRHIAGGIIGGTLVLFLIPYWQYDLSIKEYTVLGNTLFGSETFRIVLSLPIFLIGVVFAIWSNIFMFKFGEGGPADIFNIPISPRTKKLITNGPYRYCRNPMLFGAICLYTSIGIYLNSIRSLMVAWGFLVFMILYVKVFEEPRLLRDFGKDYIAYKKRVPMIFPMIRRKK